MKGLFDLVAAIDWFGLLLHNEVGGINEIERSACALAVIVDQATPGKGKDKSAKGAAGRVAWRGAVKFEESLLREVFGVGAIASGAVKEVD